MDDVSAGARDQNWKFVENPIIEFWAFLNIWKNCQQAHQQKIDHQCKWHHEPQDNLSAFSNK